MASANRRDNLPLNLPEIALAEKVEPLREDRNQANAAMWRHIPVHTETPRLPPVEDVVSVYDISPPNIDPVRRILMKSGYATRGNFVDPASVRPEQQLELQFPVVANNSSLEGTDIYHYWLREHIVEEKPVAPVGEQLEIPFVVVAQQIGESATGSVVMVADVNNDVSQRIAA